MAASLLLLQLPIPPPGMGPVEGNVPLAAAYLKLFARRQGLEKSCDIELLPPALADRLGDQGLIEAILARRPSLVGLTCYMWNVERSLWIAQRLKERRPELKVIVGGPEITADNAWVLQNPAVDYAVLGEGETALAELLAKEDRHSCLSQAKEDKHSCLSQLSETDRNVCPPAAPLENLDAISSPYVEGILDLADGGRMLLETARGCRFRCKYCYYPKGSRTQRFLSTEQILANLSHAAERGAKEVVLLDPTLNQRPDFAEFLRLLARGNHGGQLAFSGELRAEGIDAETARLLHEAHFHEVEIGLQSVEPRAWQLMGRQTDLAAFQRGVKAILAEGIKVQVDLILGLPGDTVDSVRRGIDFLVRTRAYSEVQVFNLSLLPGTAFRREAEQLGLKYQPWPPYYVLETPTLDVEQMYRLMEEAEEAFHTEFDPLPPPQIGRWDEQSSRPDVRRIDLDAREEHGHAPFLTPVGQTFVSAGENAALMADKNVCPTGRAELVGSGFPTLACILWLRSADFHRRRQAAADEIARLLTDNPHTTLQVVLEPTAEPERLTVETLALLLATCYKTTTYLDRYYSLHPGRLLGSKRLVVLLPGELRGRASRSWIARVEEYATLLWREDRRSPLPPEDGIRASSLPPGEG
jgi:radical SAM superfamily enzyme YgiQ (UPF0313 family)